jgi:hypothetical protein
MIGLPPEIIEKSGKKRFIILAGDEFMTAREAFRA